MLPLPRAWLACKRTSYSVITSTVLASSPSLARGDVNSTANESYSPFLRRCSQFALGEAPAIIWWAISCIDVEQHKLNSRGCTCSCTLSWSGLSCVECVGTEVAHTEVAHKKIACVLIARARILTTIFISTQCHPGSDGFHHDGVFSGAGIRIQRLRCSRAGFENRS